MILVTGVSGFIGKHLIKALVSEYGAGNVIALTSIPTNVCSYVLHHEYQFDKNIFVTQGVASLIDTIIHAGAFIPKSGLQVNDMENSNKNIYRTERLVNAYLPNLKKVIYLSSVDVYGASEVINEETIIDPASLYGYSKLYCEKLLEFWGASRGIVSQVLRLGHIYGPGEDSFQKVIPNTMKKLILGQPIDIWKDGEDLRSFIYIDDLTAAIVKTVKLELGLGPINLVSSNSISIKNLIYEIINTSGKESEIKFIHSSGPSRNLIFDNKKMNNYLLDTELPLKKGLANEWEYMVDLYK